MDFVSLVLEAKATCNNFVSMKMAYGIENQNRKIKWNIKNLQNLRVSLHQGKQTSELCIISQNIEIFTTSSIWSSIRQSLQINSAQVRDKGRGRVREGRRKKGGNLRKQVQGISIGSRRWNCRLRWLWSLNWISRLAACRSWCSSSSRGLFRLRNPLNTVAMKLE